MPHVRNFFRGVFGDFVQAIEFGVEFTARLEQRNAVLKFAFGFGGSVNFFVKTSDFRGGVISIVKLGEIFFQRGFENFIGFIFLKVVAVGSRSQIFVDGVNFADEIIRAARPGKQIFESLTVADLNVAKTKTNATHLVIGGAACLVDNSFEVRQANPAPRNQVTLGVFEVTESHAENFVGAVVRRFEICFVIFNDGLAVHENFVLGNPEVQTLGVFVNLRLVIKLRAVGDGGDERKIIADFFHVEQSLVRVDDINQLHAEEMVVAVEGNRIERRNFVNGFFHRVFLFAVENGTQFFCVENRRRLHTLAARRRSEAQLSAVSQAAKSPDSAKAPDGLKNFIGITDVAQFRFEIQNGNARAVVFDCDSASVAVDCNFNLAVVRRQNFFCEGFVD